MIFPIIASVAKASGIMVDKYLLSSKGMKISKFVVWLFLFLAIFTFPVLVFDSQILKEALELRQLALFGLMVILAATWNVLYYNSIKKETVQEFEPILMLSPLVVILITPIFFPQEVSQNIFYIAIIAGISLVLSHLEENHFKISRDSLGLLVSVIVMSLEVMVIRELLYFYSPATLYFFRCLILLIIYLFIYRRELAEKNRVSYLSISITGLLGVAQMLASFYGYQSAGLIFTTLVLIIAPVLVYLYCFIILKEKIKPKKLVGGVIILACVIVAYLIG